jgi:hypothetical protein
VTGLARQRDDLDDAARDLGHLECEELADQRGVRPRDRDLRPLGALADTRHVDADARAVLVLLAGHLLFRRQDRLDRAEVDVHHAGVRPLLDDAGDDVALAALELAEDLVVADVAQALVDHLLGGEGGDAAEVARAVDGLADDLALFVSLDGEDGHVAGLAVELDPGRRDAALGLVGVLEVGREDGLLDDAHELLEGDLALALHEAQHTQVDVH